MRKLVLLPETLEYRELAPITQEEFLELYDFTGDPDNAYAVFKEQNDLYDLIDIEDEFGDVDYELIITSGDTTFSYDVGRSTVVNQGVVRLVTNSSSTFTDYKPVRPNKFCIILSSSYGNMQVYDQDCKLLDTYYANFCRSNGYAIRFLVAIKKFTENNNEEKRLVNSIIESFTTTPIKPNGTILTVPKHDILDDVPTHNIKGVTLFNSEKDTLVSSPICVDIGIETSKPESLYLSMLLLSVCRIAIVNFNRLDNALLDKLTTFNESNYKVSLEDGYLNFVNENLNERIAIEYSFNELIRHYEKYTRLLINGD